MWEKNNKLRSGMNEHWAENFQQTHRFQLLLRHWIRAAARRRTGFHQAAAQKEHNHNAAHRKYHVIERRSPLFKMCLHKKKYNVRACRSGLRMTARVAYHFRRNCFHSNYFSSLEFCTIMGSILDWPEYIFCSEEIGNMLQGWLPLD